MYCIEEADGGRGGDGGRGECRGSFLTNLDS